jgi:HEAT repeat protein
MNRSKPLANAVLAAASDSDPYVQFQASLTLGDLKDPRVLATMAQLAHRSSSDAWFRAAILSSVADSASPFFHVVLAQGKSGTDQQLLIQLSALIGARQNKNEVAQWFAALTKLNQPDKFLEGLTHGLRMANARNLQVPGAEHALTRLLASSSEPVQRAAWEASRYFELGALIHRASQDAVNSDLSPAKRVLAIRALGGGHFESVAAVLEKVLQAHPSPEIEVAAVDSLAAFDEPAAGKAILESWHSFSPPARKHAVDALLAQQNRVPVLLKAIEDGQVEPAALDGGARSRLYENPDPVVAEKSHALLESTNSDRTKVVASYYEVVNMQGDIGHGKKLSRRTVPAATCRGTRGAGTGRPVQV